MLQIENLSFGYENIPLFSKVDFQLNSNELIQLKGQNGSGKTTLIKLIAGLLPPMSGSIKWTANAHYEYLPSEKNGHFTKLGASQNLNFWTAMHAQTISAANIESELAFWGLGHRIIQNGLSIEKFSTGMKRKLALARVCLSGAKVWLLDEPLSGLDEKAIHCFHDRLKKHMEQGGSCIIISHDMKVFDGFEHRTVEVERYRS